MGQAHLNLSHLKLTTSLGSNYYPSSTDEALNFKDMKQLVLGARAKGQNKHLNPNPLDVLDWLLSWTGVIWLMLTETFQSFSLFSLSYKHHSIYGMRRLFIVYMVYIDYKHHSTYGMHRKSGLRQPQHYFGCATCPPKVKIARGITFTEKEGNNLKSSHVKPRNWFDAQIETPCLCLRGETITSKGLSLILPL